MILSRLSCSPARTLVPAAGVLCCLLCGLPSSPLQAQSPGDRAAIERFRDSISAVPDSVALEALEQHMIDSARVHRNDTLLHLRLGFLALRLGEFGNKQHYEDAGSEFEWATDLQPDWPYPWYGLGLAELGVGEPEISLIAGLQNLFGTDPLSKGALAFAHAAQVDPSFVKGLVELANTALSQRINIKLDLAREALRVAGGTAAGKNPQVLLARGRVERLDGSIDSALVAFTRYVETGPNQALGLLELARTQFIAGSMAGVANYYHGASLEDSTAVAEYRKDLAYIATDSTLAAFDRTHGAARVAWLRAFWTNRDRADLREPGTRLREHYRRIHYAQENFALATLHRHYDISEIYRSNSQDFDDRGVIYIRQGEPTARARLALPGIEPNETWRYARPDGDLIFHFVAREDVQDYKLVPSLYDVLGFGTLLSLQNGSGDTVLQNRAERLLESRDQISPIYQRLYGAGSATLVSLGSQERATGRRSIELGTTSDRYELQYRQRLPARTDVMAVGHQGNRELLQVTWAIPGKALTPERVPQGYVYPVRLRVAALDRDGRAVGSVDTMRYLLSPTPVPETENLVGRMAVPVPNGELYYRVAVEQGDSTGTVTPRDSIFVGRYDGSVFSLSSVVLGWRDANLHWVRSPGDTVFFNPTGVFPRGGEMELYYEVGGLPADTPYETLLEISKHTGGLSKLLGGGKASISLRFQERSLGRVSPSRRTVQLDQLKPGQYVLRLVITAPDGRMLERLAGFEVSSEREKVSRR